MANPRVYKADLEAKIKDQEEHINKLAILAQQYHDDVQALTIERNNCLNRIDQLYRDLSQEVSRRKVDKTIFTRAIRFLNTVNKQKVPYTDLAEVILHVASTDCNLLNEAVEKAGIDSSTLIPSYIERVVIKHVKDGKKIQAIKEYRTQTGAGLKESKEAVEQITLKFKDEINVARAENDLRPLGEYDFPH